MLFGQQYRFFHYTTLLQIFCIVMKIIVLKYHWSSKKKNLVKKKAEHFVFDSRITPILILMT